MQLIDNQGPATIGELFPKPGFQTDRQANGGLSKFFGFGDLECSGVLLGTQSITPKHQTLEFCGCGGDQVGEFDLCLHTQTVTSSQ